MTAFKIARVSILAVVCALIYRPISLAQDTGASASPKPVSPVIPQLGETWGHDAHFPAFDFVGGGHYLKC